ncbi:MAG: hypothetical protein GW917_00710 [Bdellovibrionales bacterium]|nr:hypothetical protein [Bdellovibrionales bacterium]
MKSLSKTLVVMILLILSGLSPIALSQTFPILQGATDESSAEFTLQIPAEKEIEILIRDQSGKEIPLSWEKRVNVEGTEKALVKFKVHSLEVNQSYSLTVRGPAGEDLDEREFQSLNTNKRFPKVVLASCMVDWIHNPRIWDQMAKITPDLILFIGDSTYVDVGHLFDLLSRPKVDEVSHWKRFSDTRERLAVFRWKKLKPILALPDDHDFGYNNADSSFRLKDKANFVFQQFFAQTDLGSDFASGPGNSLYKKISGVSFVLLDGRNFRSSEQMFSPDQMNWISSLPLEPKTLLVSGTQFFGKYLKKDSFEGDRPEAFKVFLEELKNLPSHFSFASGDVHFSEAMSFFDPSLEYETFEITSSSVHSFTMPGRYILLPLNPRRVPGKVTSTHNFVILQWDRDNREIFTARSHGWRGQNLFECELLLK